MNKQHTNDDQAVKFVYFCAKNDVLFHLIINDTRNKNDDVKEQTNNISRQTNDCPQHRTKRTEVVR